jgi:hypothetical protein
MIYIEKKKEKKKERIRLALPCMASPLYNQNLTFQSSIKSIAKDPSRVQVMGNCH